MNMLLPTGKAANHTGIRPRLPRIADRLQVLDNASPHRLSRVEAGPMVRATVMNWRLHAGQMCVAA